MTGAKVIVLRHAQTAWNADPKRCQGQTDVPISDAGRLAARLRGSALSSVDFVYTSHLCRANETATLLTERQGLAPSIRTDPRLAEADCGHWEGQLHEQLARQNPQDWQALGRGELNFAFPGGESLGAVLRRFSDALDEIRHAHSGGKVLVVTHGGPMRLFLMAHMGRFESIPGGPPHNLEGFVIDGGRITMAGSDG